MTLFVVNLQALALVSIEPTGDRQKCNNTNSLSVTFPDTYKHSKSQLDHNTV